MMLLNIPFQNMPMAPKVKFMKNILKYDILRTIYVFNAKIGHTMHHLWRRITWELDCSVARYSSLKNQTEPIWTNNYPLLYINSHVKHGSNLIRTFELKYKLYKNKCTVIVFGVMVGPLIHTIQRYRGHQNVGKRRPHHTGGICTTREIFYNVWKGSRDGCCLKTILPYTPIYFHSFKSIYKCHINIPETTQLNTSPSLYIWMRHYNILTSNERFTLKSKTQRKMFMWQRRVNLEIGVIYIYGVP